MPEGLAKHLNVPLSIYAGSGRHERRTRARNNGGVSTSTQPLPSVRTAFARFVDYAGLFPPAKLDMPAALDAFAASSEGAHAWMLGRFIVPVSKLRALMPQGAPPLSVIVDAPPDPRAWFGAAQAAFDEAAQRRGAGFRIEALEVPLPALATKRETYDATLGQCAMLAERSGLRDLPIYVELPRDERFTEMLPGAFTALSRYRLCAKLRCGGLTASAFPSIEEIAAFLHAAAVEGVPFKATAGLHHPLRHLDGATGFVMHGFINLLAAAVFSRALASDELAAILAEEDPAAFRFDERSMSWNERSASLEEIAAAREHGFVSYGSCSFAEPVDDLTALAILPK